MTDRLTPVGSGGGAEAILVGMAVQVTHDNVIGDVAGRRREVAALPEALAPVAFAYVLEFLLYLAGRPPLGTAHEVTDRDVRRDFDEHMDVVARQRTIDDGHTHFIADLSDDLAHPEAHIADEHLVPVLRRPNEMVAMMKSRVTTALVAHSL
jgi:hypothetical protein